MHAHAHEKGVGKDRRETWKKGGFRQETDWPCPPLQHSTHMRLHRCDAPSSDAPPAMHFIDCKCIFGPHGQFAARPGASEQNAFLRVQPPACTCERSHKPACMRPAATRAAARTFGSAILASHRRPSIMCSVPRARIAASASTKLTNPKPRDLPVYRSFMTSACSSAPNCEKYSRSVSSLVSQGSPRIASFLQAACAAATAAAAVTASPVGPPPATWPSSTPAADTIWPDGCIRQRPHK